MKTIFRLWLDCFGRVWRFKIKRGFNNKIIFVLVAQWFIFVFVFFSETVTPIPQNGFIEIQPTKSTSDEYYYTIFPPPKWNHIQRPINNWYLRHFMDIEDYLFSFQINIALQTLKYKLVQKVWWMDNYHSWCKGLIVFRFFFIHLKMPNQWMIHIIFFINGKYYKRLD